MTGALGATLALAGAGLVNSTYGTLVYYGRIKAGRFAGVVACAAPDSPEGGPDCSTVMHTPYGRRFGIANTVWGIGFYAFVLVCSLARAALPAGTEQDATGGMLLFASLSAAAVASFYGVYLLWALLVRIQRPCPICYVGHTINLLLLITLLASAA